VKTYQLWQNDEGSAFFPSDHPQRELLMGTNPQLLWSVEADGWEDAIKKKYEHFGEPYVPFSDTSK
jgi:hypothetical protein